jgi:hypothetical protein
VHGAKIFYHKLNLLLENSSERALNFLTFLKNSLKMRYSPYVNKGFVYMSVSKILILEYNKLSRPNNKSFLHKREEPGNEVDPLLDVFPNVNSYLTDLKCA